MSYHSTAENTNAKMESKLESTANARNHSGFERACDEWKTVSSAIDAVPNSENSAAATESISHRFPNHQTWDSPIPIVTSAPVNHTVTCGS